MRELSRRTLLIATTTLAAVPASHAAADAPSRPTPAGTGAPSSVLAGSPPRADASQFGPLMVEVTARNTLDNTDIHGVITNTGTVDETVTFGYTDLNTGLRSRSHVITVAAGMTQTKELFGHLNHQFMVELCRSDGTCLLLGPVGHQPGTVARTRGP